MKKYLKINKRFVVLGLIMSLFTFSFAQIKEYNVIKGKVLDSKTNKVIPSVNVSIADSNITIITNSEGEFTLKTPIELLKNNIVFSALGYNSKTISLSDYNSDVLAIKLVASITNLPEVSINTFKSAKTLVEKVFDKKADNSLNNSVSMTGFYRETIKRRKRNVSLTEALVSISKQTLKSKKADEVSLLKARKKIDYKKLDTVSMKLQGGPFATLYLDVLKYSDYFLNSKILKHYSFSFLESTNYNDSQVYVVQFSPKDFELNVNYSGKLYINSKSLALVRAEYNLVLNNNKARNLLVKKKPSSIKVKPLLASYVIDYKERNNKWHYNYSKLFLRFKVNKKRSLFNKIYELSSEMVVTDWGKNETKEFKNLKKFKPNSIITEEISGFTDPDFWGVNNVIEPDKSIENAINKIEKQIKKAEKKSA